ncbi:polysaccharide biosynthesis/export family protein [Sphingomonas nostoxanthinifaciens]|nr:polysaccharide biosynthesis/export family protein [Sphingomonas nostoxanthinifaciens]
MFVVAGLAIALASQAGAAPQPAKGAPGANADLPSGYRISPGDQLDIYVWGDERLQRQLSVLPDGTFAFPLAGTIRAAGRAPTDIEAELSKLLASQYKGVAPQVTVSVRAPTGMQISVIGRVRSPGTFSPNRYVSVIDALALAGGPTEFADVGNITILRHEGDRTRVIRAHLSGLLKGKPSGDDLGSNGVPQLLAGDTVVVP